METKIRGLPNAYRYVDENENKKLFGKQELKQPLYHYPTNDKQFQNEIQEAKEVLAMFNVPASKFVGLSDIDELRSMMYGIEHQLLDVIEDRKLIKAIFNNAGRAWKKKPMNYMSYI